MTLFLYILTLCFLYVCVFLCFICFCVLLLSVACITIMGHAAWIKTDDDDDDDDDDDGDC